MESELGKVYGLGEALERSTLHQDPFQNLALAKEHKEQLELTQEKLKQGREKRIELKENIV